MLLGRGRGDAWRERRRPRAGRRRGTRRRRRRRRARPGRRPTVVVHRRRRRRRTAVRVLTGRLAVSASLTMSLVLGDQRELLLASRTLVLQLFQLEDG